MPQSSTPQSDPPFSQRYKAAYEWLDKRFPAEDEEQESYGPEVADSLRALGADDEVLTAALLSSRIYAERLPLDDIKVEFGEVIEMLVRNVRQLNTVHSKVNSDSQAPEKAERMRRLLLAIIDDVRAVVIKLGYRLVRLRHLKIDDIDLRQQVARETLDIFAPLANRLGVAQLKWELEDLAFRFLEPHTYKDIAGQLQVKRTEREEYIEDFKTKVRGLARDASIDAQVSGRPKHIYSIWKKITRKDVGLDELYDLRALRVIVPTLADCYAMLGLVHMQWNTIPKEFDDYIANPKPNGYQSLHTVVLGPSDRPVEVQIRTQKMHDYAELGFAAHWRYKEESGEDNALHNAINSLRSLLGGDTKDHREGPVTPSPIFPDRVFVMTPAGDAVELGKGATPLDFAYAIHTELGHRCRGAKVNGHIVPLSHSLQTGETVEVLTRKRPHPSRDWMNPKSGYLSSAKARTKVRSWWHLQDLDDHRELGKKKLEQVKRKFEGVSVPIGDLLHRFGSEDEDSFYVAIGRGDVRSAQLETLYKPKPEEVLKPHVQSTPPAAPSASAAVQGVENLLTNVAQCCKPVPGDDVVGYITKGRGITVHRRDCANMRHLPPERVDRMVEVQWGQSSASYPVTIQFSALDRAGLINEITHELSVMKVRLLKSVNYTDLETQQVNMKLTVQIHDSDQLETLMGRMRKVKGVLALRRI